MSAPGGAPSGFFTSISSWWGSSPTQAQQPQNTEPTTPEAPEESNAAKRARLAKNKYGHLNTQPKPRSARKIAEIG